MTELWKPVKNYEGCYEISNYGRVKSLARKWDIGNNGKASKDTTFLKIAIRETGYLYVGLHINGKKKTYSIHTLVWDYFGDRKRNSRTLQVDHINGDKLNNRIDNLQLLTPRDNVSKGWKSKETTSIFTGVCWNKKSSKWRADILVNGSSRTIGLFSEELDAHLAYEKAKSELKPERLF